MIGLTQFREIAEWAQPHVLGGQMVKNSGKIKIEIVSF